MEETAVLQEARRSFEEWRAKLSAMARPSAEALVAVRAISQQLKTVDGALRAARTGKPSEGWKKELALYRESLESLQKWLANLEITLQIERSQMHRHKDHLRAVRSWSELTRQIA